MAEDDKHKESKRTHGVVERIEDGGTAVIHVGDDESMKVELPTWLLPAGAEEGSHLLLNISRDEDSRKAAEDRVKALQEKLEKRGGAKEQKSFKL
jgi:Protein of unknown function (DUF3006)